LEGAALAAISGLSLTESNYKNAIEILTERFGNEQLIISSHMEALLQLPAVTSITDIFFKILLSYFFFIFTFFLTRHFESGIWHLDKLLKSLKVSTHEGTSPGDQVPQTMLGPFV